MILEDLMIQRWPYNYKRQVQLKDEFEPHTWSKFRIQKYNCIHVSIYQSRIKTKAVTWARDDLVLE